MSTLGRAVIEFSAETAKFTGDVGRAAAMFEKNMLGMQRAVDGLLGKIGIAGGTAGIALMVKSSIDLADQTFKASQKISLTTNQISEMGFAFKLADVEQDGFVKGFVKFEEALVKAGDSASKEARIFKALGVDITKGPLEAFRQLSDAMKNLPAQSGLQAPLARALMGRGGVDMIPGMMEGSKGFDEAAEKARRLGLSIGPEMAKMAQDFNDSMKMLELGAKGLGMTLTRELLGPLTDISNRLAEGALKGPKGFLSSIGDVLNRSAAATITGLSEVTGIKLDPRVQAEMDKAFGLTDPMKPDPLRFMSRIRGVKPQRPEDMGPVITDEMRRKRAADLAKALQTSDDTARKAAAQLLKYEGAVQSLEQQMGKLNNQTEAERVIYALTAGSLRGLTTDQEAHIIALAGDIDTRKQALMVGELTEQSYDQIRERLEALNAAESQGRDSKRQMLEQMEFEVSLLGKSAQEQEVMNFRRQQAVRLEEELAQAAKMAGDDMAQYDKARAEIIARANDTVLKGTQIIRERQAAEREWLYGAREALDGYADAAMNAARNASEAFTNGFRKMEDALVEFAMTGKLNFKDLADSIIRDIIRIQVREQITGPIAKAASSFLGDAVKSIFGSFGGGRAEGGPLESGKWYVAGERGPEPIWGGGAGAFAAGYPSGGGGNTYYIDARGADIGVEQRLTRALLSLAGPGVVEQRAVGAVFDQNLRGNRA